MKRDPRNVEIYFHEAIIQLKRIGKDKCVFKGLFKVDIGLSIKSRIVDKVIQLVANRFLSMLLSRSKEKLPVYEDYRKLRHDEFEAYRNELDLKICIAE